MSNTPNVVASSRYAYQVGYEHPNTLRVLLRERTGQTTRTLRGKTGALA